MAFISGWGGRVKSCTVPSFSLQYTSLPVTRWQVSSTTELAETTSGPDPVRKYVPGYTDLEVSFDCLWDSSLGIFGTSLQYLNLTPGGYTALYLYLNRNAPGDRSAFILPYVLISSCVLDGEVRGVFKYQVIGKQSSSLSPSGVGIQYPLQ